MWIISQYFFNVEVGKLGTFLLPFLTFQLGLSGSRHVLLHFPLSCPFFRASTHTRLQEHFFFFSLPLGLEVVMVSHSCCSLGPSFLCFLKLSDTTGSSPSIKGTGHPTRLLFPDGSWLIHRQSQLTMKKCSLKVWFPGIGSHGKWIRQ